jgi:hypothetical protein
MKAVRAILGEEGHQGRQPQRIIAIAVATVTTSSCAG